MNTGPRGPGSLAGVRPGGETRGAASRRTPAPGGRVHLRVFAQGAKPAGCFTANAGPRRPGIRPCGVLSRGRRRRSSRAGMSVVTTEFAPITQRSPMVTPLVMTTLAPHQTLSPTRVGPLRGEALPRHRLVRVVEAVVGVGHEAAVGEHAVLADLDEVDRRDLHAEVEERAAADADPCRRLRRQPHAGLEQDVLAELQPPLLEHLEDVAVDGPAAERPAARELVVDARPVPGQGVALVPAPFLRPELDRGRIQGAEDAMKGGLQGVVIPLALRSRGLSAG